MKNTDFAQTKLVTANMLPAIVLQITTVIIALKMMWDDIILTKVVITVNNPKGALLHMIKTGFHIQRPRLSAAAPPPKRTRACECACTQRVLHLPLLLNVFCHNSCHGVSAGPLCPTTQQQGRVHLCDSARVCVCVRMCASTHDAFVYLRFHPPWCAAAIDNSHLLLLNIRSVKPRWVIAVISGLLCGAFKASGKVENRLYLLL